MGGKAVGDDGSASSFTYQSALLLMFGGELYGTGSVAVAHRTVLQFGSQYAHTRSCFAGYLRVDDSQVLYGTSRTATYEAHFVGVTLRHRQVAYRVPAAVKCSVVSLLVVVFLV